MTDDHLPQRITVQGRTRVKFCGMTHLADAQQAVSAGADAIGWVFYPPSSRAVSVSAVRAWSSQLPPWVAQVALLVNPTPADVQQVLANRYISSVQFHGDESDDFCRQFACPFIKAIRAASAEQLAQACQQFPSAQALLVDAACPGQWGGTGQVFDWTWLAALDTMSLPPIIVAGGLNAANVSQAIQQLRPYAVDVSGGIEAVPGRKDQHKMQAFMQAVWRVDHSSNRSLR